MTFNLAVVLANRVPGWRPGIFTCKQSFTTSLSLPLISWPTKIRFESSVPVTTELPQNLKSTLLYLEAVTEALHKEISKGHTAGPLSSLPLPTLQCSPPGVVPEKDGSWRIIMDLSSPQGSSINDFIAKQDNTLHYVSFNQALALVSSLGTGALMAKLDLKHAFRLCPVSPIDRDLLGMH